MPFVGIEEVEAMMLGSVVKLLRDGGKFAAVESEAAKLVRDTTGLAIPDSVSARPATADWVVAPMAWLIQYLALPGVTTNDAVERRLETQYKEAMKILNNHPLQGVPAGTPKIARSGAIEGMYE